MGRRKQIVVTPEMFVHISPRATHGLKFPVSLNEVWKVYEDHLYSLHYAYDVEIYAFVLMTNHFHLLAKFPNSNMSLSMNVFQRDTSREINRLAGRNDQTYGNRYRPTVINSETHLAYCYRYIYQNPVRAKICKTILDYPYSSIAKLFGKIRCAIPIIVDPFSDELHFTDKNLEWLNQLPNETETEIVRKALKKNSFDPGKDRSLRTKICLPDQLAHRAQ